MNTVHVPGQMGCCDEAEATVWTQPLASLGSTVMFMHTQRCPGVEHLATALATGQGFGAEMFVYVALEQDFRFEEEHANGAAVG